MIKESQHPLALSGCRFRATYALVAKDRDEAMALARAIAVEQTIEFPPELVARQDIHDQIVGQIESLDALPGGRFSATLAFPDEAAGGELTQLINVLFGNISLLPGVELLRFSLGDALARGFKGPRYGRAGLRKLLGVPERPLLCTALKPMGLSPDELAEIAYHLAKGGVDMIKDDHGLSDQAFSPFEARVKAASQAVRRANEETGGRCRYFPNITAGPDQLHRRAKIAKEAGAGGAVISPGLAGFDALRLIAEEDALALPLMAHPAFLGSFGVSQGSGISHLALYGQLMRLAGADISIFPNFGGRFCFSPEDCLGLVEGTREEMAHFKPIFPAPAGGMKVARVPELVRFYGRDVVLLIGGDLHRGGDLEARCRQFRALVD